MLKKGTQVYVYEDPLTRLILEGTAKIVAHIVGLETGVARYKVHFDADFTGDTHERTIVEAVATFRCCCFEQAGDNPECKVHERQVDRC